MFLPALWNVFLVSDILEYIGIPIFFALCFGHKFFHGRREACGVGIGEMGSGFESGGVEKLRRKRSFRGGNGIRCGRVLLRSVSRFVVLSVFRFEDVLNNRYSRYPIFMSNKLVSSQILNGIPFFPFDQLEPIILFLILISLAKKESGKKKKTSHRSNKIPPSVARKAMSLVALSISSDIAGLGYENTGS